MLSVLIFSFLFSGPKNISLLQKTKSIPIKLCILDSNSSEYELLVYQRSLTQIFLMLLYQNSINTANLVSQVPKVMMMIKEPVWNPLQLHPQHKVEQNQGEVGHDNVTALLQTQIQALSSSQQHQNPTCKL